MIPDEIEEFPLLIVGAGRMGSAWIEALASRPQAAGGAFVSGVCDPDPRTLHVTLSLPGIEVQADLEEAIQAASPRGAILTTPPDTHPDLAWALLSRGIPVLCDKPLALDEETARSMFQAAWEARTPLWLASTYRFVGDIQRGAELVRSGLFGEPLGAWIEFADSFPVVGKWQADPRRSGGGVLADNGPHAAELARHFLGPVIEAAAFSLPRRQRIPVEDSACLAFRHRCGALTSVFLSWSLAPSSPWYYRLEGSEGTLLIGWKEARYKVHEAPDWVSFGRGYRKLAALAAMAGAFAGALRGQTDYPVTALEALASVAVTAAAARSLSSGSLEEVASEEET